MTHNDRSVDGATSSFDTPAIPPRDDDTPRHRGTETTDHDFSLTAQPAHSIGRPLLRAMTTHRDTVLKVKGGRMSVDTLSGI